jgi:hypothetical protein
MKNKIIWLRVSYWTAVFSDAYSTYLMLFPKIAHGLEYR